MNLLNLFNLKQIVFFIKSLLCNLYLPSLLPVIFFFYLVLSFSLTCLYSVFYIDWRSMKLIDSFISCVVCYWQSEWLRSHAKSKITLILSNGKASEPAFKMCFILVIRVKHQTSKHLSVSITWLWWQSPHFTCVTSGDCDGDYWILFPCGLPCMGWLYLCFSAITSAWWNIFKAFPITPQIIFPLSKLWKEVMNID